MFYLRYLRSELLRRRARTILTVLGLAVGVGLVIAISGLSRGLDDAQKTALDPLSTIGTDLTVTRAAQTTASAGFGGGPGGGGGELIQANSSVITDLSKLGKPGTHFVHDFFLPGTQLTFPTSQGAKVKSLAGVAAVSQGLVLVAEHQEGTVPKIVAKIKTGGQTFRIRRRITPLTAAEQAQIQACLVKNGVTNIAPQGQGNGGGGAGGFGAGGNGGGGRTGGRGGFGGAFAKCLPARLQQFRANFTTPQQTLKQVLDPPQTNIKTTPYTIAGVDLTQSDIALVTPTQVTKGVYFNTAGGKEALVSASYASREKLKVGSPLTLNGVTFHVVGLVSPPLGGQSADVYLPLAQLQKLANQKGLANIVLVRADKSSSVASVKREITTTLGGAQVASASQVADTITGSLVDASNLSHNLGVVLEILVAGAAFSSRRCSRSPPSASACARLGTLKAIGWTQRLVVRQVVGESVAQGVGRRARHRARDRRCGAVQRLRPDAHRELDERRQRCRTSARQRDAPHRARPTSLHAPLSIGLLLGAPALAIAAASSRAPPAGCATARLRPADASRRVE